MNRLLLRCRKDFELGALMHSRSSCSQWYLCYWFTAHLRGSGDGCSLQNEPTRSSCVYRIRSNIVPESGPLDLCVIRRIVSLIEIHRLAVRVLHGPVFFGFCNLKFNAIRSGRDQSNLNSVYTVRSSGIHRMYYLCYMVK